MIPILGVPWAITEDGMRLVLSIASRGELFAEVKERALAARDGKPLDNTRTVTVRDGVAVIPVAGPLFRHASMFAEISGATSYATIRKDLQAAIEDPAVSAIVLDINSPGGEVNGVAELAQAIYESRGKKPIKAYVGGLGASAAYWIASAADEVIAADTAQLGSIGVVSTIADYSEADKMAGIKTIEIVSSQSPDKRLDPSVDSDRAKIQRAVDDLAQVFVDAVARHRSVSAEKVLERYGQGGVMIGARAVSAGLADRLGSFEAVLSEMTARKRDRMDALLLGLRADAGPEEIEARAKSLVAIEREIMSATGAASADEALGRARAGAAAVAELAKLRAERAAEAALANRAALRGDLEKALASQCLTLGQLVAVVPTLLDDAVCEAATDALAKVEKHEAGALLDALCSVDVSPKSLARVRGFLAVQVKATPTAATEPKREEGRAQIVDEDEEGKVIANAAAKARAHWDKQRPRK